MSVERHEEPRRNPLDRIVLRADATAREVFDVRTKMVTRFEVSPTGGWGRGRTTSRRACDIDYAVLARIAQTIDSEVFDPRLSA